VVTIAVGASKDAAFLIGQLVSASTLIDMSSEVTKIDFTLDGNAIDVSTMGNTFKSYINGMKDGSASIEGIYDATGKSGTLLFNLGTALVPYAFAYGPQGTASGAPKFSGSAIVVSYSAPANLDEAVTFACEIKTTGTVTRGTF
jgi:predicted secreted protein